MINEITAGANAPEQINVIIEISANSSPVKYEFNKELNILELDRFVGTNMSYPFNYGYIPGTLGQDGDPLDAIVISPYPLLPMCLVEVTPLGMLNMTDESGVDEKLVCVPIEKKCGLYAGINEINELPKLLLDQIEHFFQNYKALEPGKWVKISGWSDSNSAKDTIKKYLLG